MVINYILLFYSCIDSIIQQLTCKSHLLNKFLVIGNLNFHSVFTIKWTQTWVIFLLGLLEHEDGDTKSFRNV
jgi:hypothetical protein